MSFKSSVLTTDRHRTRWIEAGPTEGPLIIFVHGWPEHSLVWRPQLEYFAAHGWRGVAPDMRGYGGSSVPDRVEAYAMTEIVQDLIDLQDALGGSPAVWVGHDWGSAAVWALLAHHPRRCRAVASLCVPYFPEGMTLEAVTALSDRTLYPPERFPDAQWSYWRYHIEQFAKSTSELETDIRGTITALYRQATKADIAKPSPLSAVGQTGWFGRSGRPPRLPRDADFMPEADFEEVVAAFRTTGFRGACAWYLNDAANAAYARSATAFGAVTAPVLFIHAAWDTTCDTLQSRLAEPMRLVCSNLTESTIQAGHELMLDQPGLVCDAISGWLDAHLPETPQ